ncbi:DUF2490 domain-containing protein [Salinimicrobium sp. MT39]|uniref:DUF2490 domain-containing protein n=1 Tax=Salinimicrobium profundisediminis TaxID=2994553 RepID=A0A9X3CUM6_9FLAO|nr:DUF2490 domain-containing protein [Salinimicrobium profundisediminis]MCX2836971.1 DUF2490 domain-containing protein [Salinimicrobium profundisediminis]
MPKKAIFLLSFLYTISLSAQNKEDLLGSWTEIIGQHHISEKWSIPTVALLQHYEMFDKFQFIMLRSGVTYAFSKDFSASVGYDYVYSEAFSEDSFTIQHRVWEEATLKTPFLSPYIAHRFRLESTWKRQEPEYDLSHRVRYRLKFDRPLYKSLYFTAFNEVFINLKEPYFNQNRFHFGLGYSLHQDLKIEIGYLKNHFRRAHYDRIRVGMVFKTRFLEQKER